MPVSEEPTWIELLLKQLVYSCAEPEFVSFRQSVLRGSILEKTEAEHDGARRLREACEAHLGDEDATVVVNAVSCLFVVGDRSSLPRLRRLETHPAERVRKAVRTSMFEIESRLRREPE